MKADFPERLKAVFDELTDLIADRIVAKLKEEERSSPPIPIKEAASLTKKSVSHLRREVHAGRIKRVPGTSRILIPSAEIKRIQAGAVVSKI